MAKSATRCTILRHAKRLQALNPSFGWAWATQQANALDLNTYHPGYAWAGRADWLRKYGLHDSMVSGGGDSLMVKGFTSRMPRITTLPNDWRASLNAWADPVSKEIRGNLGYVDQNILHLWHGDRQNRQYIARWEYLLDNNFTPSTDIKAGYLFDLAASVRNSPAPIVVEIGVYGGRSFLPLTAGLGNAGIAIAVDPWSNDEASAGDIFPSHAEWWAKVDLEQHERGFHAAMQRLGLRYLTLRMTSAKARSAFPLASVALVHVDGRHDEPTALDDLQAWYDRLGPGGFMVVDDVTNAGWPGVGRALPWLEARCSCVHDGGNWRAYQKD